MTVEYTTEELVAAVDWLGSLLALSAARTAPDRVRHVQVLLAVKDAYRELQSRHAHVVSEYNSLKLRFNAMQAEEYGRAHP